MAKAPSTATVGGLPASLGLGSRVSAQIHWLQYTIS